MITCSWCTEQIKGIVYLEHKEDAVICERCATAVYYDLKFVSILAKQSFGDDEPQLFDAV